MYLPSFLQLAFPSCLPVSCPRVSPVSCDAQEGDQEVQRLVAQLITGGATHLANAEGALADALQAQISTPVRHLTSGSIRSYRRVLDTNQDIVFFANQSAEAATLQLETDTHQPLWWFDALSGAAWPASGTDGTLALSLRGFESRFLIRGVPMPTTLAPRVAGSVALEQSARSWPLDAWELAIDGAPAGASNCGTGARIPRCAMRVARLHTPTASRSMHCRPTRAICSIWAWCRDRRWCA